MAPFGDFERDSGPTSRYALGLDGGAAKVMSCTGAYRIKDLKVNKLTSAILTRRGFTTTGAAVALGALTGLGRADAARPTLRTPVAPRARWPS